MKLKAIITSSALALSLASTALALSPVERNFLGADGLLDRLATIDTTQPQPSESWVTNQGGSAGKPCDNASIPANIMTQVSSDNAYDNGNPGPWQAGGSGFVTLLNNSTKLATCTADFFYGDQTQLGSDLQGYWHTIPVQWLRIAPMTGVQVNWQNQNLEPLAGAAQNDWMADFLFITCSQPVSCTTNAYQTVEHN